MSQNFYEPSQVDPFGQQPPGIHRGTRLPGFVKGFIITDLVLCSLRAIAVLVGIFGYLAIQQNANMPGVPAVVAETALYEVLSGLGIVVFGFIAGIMILCKKPAGVIFGYPALLFTLASTAVGIWQSSAMIEAAPAGTPEAAGMLVGLVVAVLFRVVLAILYFVALLMASKALASND
ncbi:MAG: hypothetical protein HQ567_02910 [Candidatus Nealsonbacteria bacterium]|nr:hypothetical protein [Candidatus Nealsonbacteria bacterium]